VVMAVRIVTVPEVVKARPSAVALTVAALYVDPNGVYADLPGVEVWDEARDARLYAGPWPVVAHPPCKSWSRMGLCRGLTPGPEDIATFRAAVDAVERCGGVLEHPAHSRAWSYFGLPQPPAAGWSQQITRGGGWACQVDQAHYGYGCRKPTWLYYSGPDPPALIWGPSGHPLSAANFSGGEKGERTGSRPTRSATPTAFRDVLLEMARSAA
jgi:hypothetical protein